MNPATPLALLTEQVLADVKRCMAAKVAMMFTSARRRALQQGLAFDLELADVETPVHCPVFGFALKYNNPVLADSSPTLDRIWPEFGYVKGNVRVISWKANRLKNNASLEDLLALVSYLKEEEGRVWSMLQERKQRQMITVEELTRELTEEFK